MAEGPPAASKPETILVTEYRPRPEREVVIKQVYSSALWYYPVHKYIGDIVQGQYHSVNLLACRTFI